MSASGTRSINSGPLIIRTYTSDTNNKSYILTDYDIPVAPNRVLITSIFGELIASNSIDVSSITVSSINGTSYPPSDDAFWSGSLAGTIHNDNSGTVTIGTTTPLNPSVSLDVSGYTVIHSGNGNTNGFLGINTYPGRQFDCVGDAEISGTLYLPNTLSSVNISTNNLRVLNDNEIQPFQSNNGQYMYVDTSVTSAVRLGGYSTGAIPLCLQVDSGGASDGNVGIGTTNPQAELDVSGTVRASQYILSNGTNIASSSFKNLINSGTTITNPGIYTIISTSLFLISINLDTSDSNNLGAVFGFIITDNSTQDVNIQVFIGNNTFSSLSTISLSTNKNKLFLIYYQASNGANSDVGYTFT